MDTEARGSRLVSINPLALCLISLSIYLLVVVGKHQFLISDDQLFSEFTGTDFDEYKSATDTFRKLKYIFLSLTFLGSILFTFLLISTTNFLVKSGLSLRNLFIVAVLTSYTEIVSEGFIIVWFASLETFHSSDVFSFYPLSLFSLLDNTEDISFPVSFLLQSLNLFFIFKILLIGYAYHMLTKKSFGESLIAALITYLIPMMIFYFLLYCIF